MPGLHRNATAADAFEIIAPSHPHPSRARAVRGARMTRPSAPAVPDPRRWGSGPRGHWILAGLVFLLSALVAGTIVWQSEQARLRIVRTDLQRLAAAHAGTLQRNIEADMDAAYAVAALVRQQGGTPADFAAYAEALRRFYPDLVTLNLAPGGVVRHASPLRGNESVIGLDLFADPVRANEAVIARDSGRLTLAGPYDLISGGSGMVGRLPVFLDARQTHFWGLVNVVLRLPEALVPARLAQLAAEGIDYQLWRIDPQSRKTQVIAASTEQRLSDPVEHRLTPPIDTWVLSVTPAAGWANPLGLTLKTALGVIFSLLLSTLTKLLLDSRTHARRLAALIEERIDISERIRTDRELRIAATVFEAREGMLVTDARSVILRVNQAFCENTGYRPEDVVGKTPRMLQSGHHDADFYAAMWEHIQRSGAWQGEIWNRRKNGEIYPEWLTITAVKDRDGVVINYVGTHTDITQRKAAENEIRHLAYYDPLTQLPNRRLLMDRLHQNLANAARYAQRGALLFIDLDKFKTLNDTLGHEVGDQLLQQVAKRLSESVREGDTVARLGGDEFVVMLQHLGDSPTEAASLARIVAEKIRGRLDEPYQLGAHSHLSTASIGVILFGGRDETIEDLLRFADLAMYQAKAAGRNKLHVFDPAMQSALSMRASLENDLQQGIESGQLLLHYQAQFDDRDRLLGAEALVRWLHPEHGWVAPGDIIELAESTGQILLLAQCVLEIACRQLATWNGQAGKGDWSLSVNISPKELRHPGFVQAVESALRLTGADPSKLVLELPESLILGELAETRAKMMTLKALGVRFALDNFGNGYGSLVFVRRLPLDQLKIGPAFIDSLLAHPNEDVIAHAFMELIHGLGLELLAEGVETQEQRDFLVLHGCRTFQGYFFARPGSAQMLG